MSRIDEDQIVFTEGQMRNSKDTPVTDAAEHPPATKPDDCWVYADVCGELEIRLNVSERAAERLELGNRILRNQVETTRSCLKEAIWCVENPTLVHRARLNLASWQATAGLGTTDERSIEPEGQAVRIAHVKRGGWYWFKFDGEQPEVDPVFVPHKHVGAMTAIYHEGWALVAVPCPLDAWPREKEPSMTEEAADESQ